MPALGATQAYQKVLLVYGTIADPSIQKLEGTVTVSRLDDNFPPTQWPVCDSHFKALVYLLPGANRLRFDFSSPKLANSNSTNPIHSSYVTVHMIPPTNAPPLQLAVIVASDSPETYDAAPARVEREGNGLDTAVRKFRMAAYLWQAFTAEHMWRQRLGRRVFRFDEEWMTGSACLRDREMGHFRSEARVHVIRSTCTVEQLRAMSQNELFAESAAAVKRHFKPLPGQKLYVAALLLDAHWDPATKVVAGHAARGDVVDDVHLSVFGSHCLQTYPKCFEEVVPAFTDCTPTDAAVSADERGGAGGSSWETANAGIGAHLRQTGRLFGCTDDRDGGFLAPGSPASISRTFLSREAYSTRTRSKGGPLVDRNDEAAWHRLDCLRFRGHPCFRLPNDAFPATPDGSIAAWTVENGGVTVTAPSGVAFVEIFEAPSGSVGEQGAVSKAWLEYPLVDKPPGSSGTPPLEAVASGAINSGGSIHSSSNLSVTGGGHQGLQRQVALTEALLRDRIEAAENGGGRRIISLGSGSPTSGAAAPWSSTPTRLRVVVRSCAGGELVIDDFRQLVGRANSVVKIQSPSPSLSLSSSAAGSSLSLPLPALPGLSGSSGAGLGYKSMPFGGRRTDVGDGSSPLQDVMFTSAARHNRVLSRIVAYKAGSGVGGSVALRGLEFVYDDDSRQLFGTTAAMAADTNSSEGLTKDNTADIFDLDVRRGEYVSGFLVRAGDAVYGVQVLTSMGRRSPFFGNAHGGSG